MNMRAISPVIATVIIVSVAIAIAVAVAFWMTGITGIFTRYEKLEVISAYATKTGANQWSVVIIVKNTGSTDATIDNIFINGIPYGTLYSDGAVDSSVTVDSETVQPGTEAISLGTGVQKTITFTLRKGNTYTFTSGQVVEIKLHTAAGNEYPKSVQLP